MGQRFELLRPDDITASSMIASGRALQCIDWPLFGRKRALNLPDHLHLC